MVWRALHPQAGPALLRPCCAPSRCHDGLDAERLTVRPLQLWAGPECTVNRLGDAWRDQLVETGFADRLDDIDRIASLGVPCMRLPLLWERCATGTPGVFDWRWTDARMARLRACGLQAVAGLVHHGSGPPHTHLLAPNFAPELAAYAGALARRFPGLEAYTPVNEPTTTARFAGLYGLWYPHRRDDASFVRALLNQQRATVLAMHAVRRVNSSARLVQTDDLGYTSTTPALQYQADFENQRRWLGFDLLFGRVDRQHPLWGYLRRHGASEDELMAFVDAPCPPDITGINCYVTSERFLDERLALHPSALHGGNGRHRYVDVETVRTFGALPDGVGPRLHEAWCRYRRPVALTEAHLGCTREEQMRWLAQAWDAALALRARGVDVRAVTAWAAFGTVDWDSLVTRASGHYEPGLWDVRSQPPRPTALAQLARTLAQGSSSTALAAEPHAALAAADALPAPNARHPVAADPGWWQRPVRHLYPVVGAAEHLAASGPLLLIAGAGGTLGRAFAQLCHLRGLRCRVLTRAELDIAQPLAVEAALQHWQPWAFINAAGFVDIDRAQSHPRQWRDNVLGPATLAQACARHGLPLLTFSSDQVFDGEQAAPYLETDTVRPLNAYGLAKAQAERLVLRRHPAALVVRSAAFFGPWDAHNFLARGLQALGSGQRWRAAGDQVVSPTSVRDLVMCALDLLIDGECGLWHLANQGRVSWADFALMAASRCDLDTSLIDTVRSSDTGQQAPRPRQAALQSARGTVMPTLDVALTHYLLERQAEGGPAEADAEAHTGMPPRADAAAAALRQAA